MALIHETKVFAASDCRISKLLTDPAGAPTTYAASVNVPGIKSLAVSRVYNQKELRGDNQLLDTEAILERITLKIAYAKLAFDAEAIITGATVTDSGTTPNQIAKLRVLPTDSIPNWKLEASCVRADVPGSDVHIVAYKCRISANLDMGLNDEDYQLFAFEATASPTIGTPLSWMDEIYNETAAVIA